MTPEWDLPSWAVVTPARRAHIARVAVLTREWARALGVSAGEAARWERAALLHDALRDADAAVLARYAPPNDWPHALWHGPAAAAAAAAEGEADTGVLDAVRYHSIGCADWDDCGRVLFLADYLEPGRTHDRAGLDAIAARVPKDLAGAVREVTARRLAYLIRHREPVRRETWELWNSLVPDAASS